MDGFWLIDKPATWTSFDICAKMRKALNTKKVGHTGTLDPFATGLLLVATGKCTRLIPFLEKERKTYRTKILLNKTSDTLDPTSEIRDIDCDTEPTREDIENILKKNFTGKIEQTPPQFSAIKINGKRAYDLARKGEKVDLKPRPAEVFDWKILNYSFPELEIEIEVGAGFYVRSFARDLGKALTGGGMCQELRRTHVGALSVDDAETLEMISQPIDPKHIITSLEQIELPSGRMQDFIAGRAFPYSGLNGEKYLVLSGGRTFGVAEIIAGKLQPRVVI